MGYSNLMMFRHLFANSSKGCVRIVVLAKILKHINDSESGQETLNEHMLVDLDIHLLLHMEETDNRQVFTDSSAFEHAINNYENVKTKNTLKQFGVLNKCD